MSSTTDIYIYDYTAKSFVIRGDTQPHKDSIKAMGGKWGSNYTDKESGEKFGGWGISLANIPKIMIARTIFCDLLKGDFINI